MASALDNIDSIGSVTLCDVSIIWQGLKPSLLLPLGQHRLGRIRRTELAADLDAFDVVLDCLTTGAGILGGQRTVGVAVGLRRLVLESACVDLQHGCQPSVDLFIFELRVEMVDPQMVTSLEARAVRASLHFDGVVGTGVVDQQPDDEGVCTG
ncbi:hypothetical protein [Novosphingobium cyanobacteriorum]|uniref:hypothetical protein n=1 Tax=Novosphingobium cyanobacteriorum TaxID=3024215 RepID=UPI0023F91C03|nr:hypothetical protein [Novosphingobium cyanobacteriorum]